MIAQPLPTQWAKRCRQGLERLPWPVQVSGQAYGVRLRVRTNQPAVLERIAPLLPPGWTAADGGTSEQLYSVWVGAQPGDSHRLFAGRRRLAECADLEYLLDRFESDMQIHLGEAAPQRVFVHAGVVGWRGQAIVIPGRSYAGKSTLVAALLRAGASYYSDEFAVLDEQGRVHPYPRLLSLRRGDGQRPLRCAAAALGGQAGAGPLPVGLVVLARYQPERRWRPLRLAPGPALLQLVRHCLPIRRRPREALTALQQALAPASVLQGVRGEAQEMTGELLNRW